MLGRNSALMPVERKLECADTMLKRLRSRRKHPSMDKDNWIVAFSVLSMSIFLASVIYFVHGKVKNDSSIAEDTKRIAVALELLGK